MCKKWEKITYFCHSKNLKFHQMMLCANFRFSAQAKQLLAKKYRFAFATFSWKAGEPFLLIGSWVKTGISGRMQHC
jgi:hypothetical protein